MDGKNLTGGKSSGRESGGLDPLVTKHVNDVRVNVRYSQGRLEKAKEVCKLLKKWYGLQVEPDTSRFFWTLLDKFLDVSADRAREYEEWADKGMPVAKGRQ